MDSNLRHATSYLDGLSVLIYNVALFSEFQMSLDTETPAHAWHTAGGHLMSGPFLLVYASSVHRAVKDAQVAKMSRPPLSVENQLIRAGGTGSCGSSEAEEAVI